MEGRYPGGLFFALTNCNDPANEEEFNSWYSHKHLPDVTGPGVWRHASRYVNTAPSPEDGKYLALYETYRDDVVAARKEMIQTDAKVRELGRHSPHIRSVLVTTFKRLGGEFLIGGILTSISRTSWTRACTTPLTGTKPLTHKPTG